MVDEPGRPEPRSRQLRMPVADDELPGEVSRTVDSQRPASDEELIPGRRGQFEDGVLPASEHRYDPSGRPPYPHKDDAVPAGDAPRGNAGRPAPVHPRSRPEGNQCLPGPEPSGRSLVLGISPEQLQLFERIRRGDPPTVDRFGPRL